MNTKYNIITKTSYKEFCEKSEDIQIVENDLENRIATLMDKFGNKCQIDYKEDDTILALTRIGGNDPVYMLHLLVTVADAIFLSEVDFKNFIQVHLMNESHRKMLEISDSAYEGFTHYFRDYVKYFRDFDKEYQLITEKKQTDASKMKNVSNSLVGRSTNALVTKATGKDHKKLDDYFELDEDFEI